MQRLNTPVLACLPQGGIDGHTDSRDNTTAATVKHGTISAVADENGNTTGLTRQGQCDASVIHERHVPSFWEPNQSQI